MQRRLQGFADAVLGGFPQGVECQALLFAAGGFARAVVAAETEKIAVDDDIDIFGETVNQLPCLGERRAAFEGEVRTPLRQGKEFTQCPADSEILLDAGRTQAHARFRLLTRRALVIRREREVSVHALPGVFCQLVKDVTDPRRCISGILQQCGLVFGFQIAT